MSPTPEGTEFYFPAARNKSFAGMTTVFLLIFSSVTLVLIYARVFLLFPLAFGFFSLLLLYGTLQMWLGTTRVVIGGAQLFLQAGLLGSARLRQVSLSKIESIRSRIAAQQGGSTGTPYYNIELTLTSGKKLTLGRFLRDKHETDWLVGEMSRLAGLDRKTMTAGMQ